MGMANLIEGIKDDIMLVRRNAAARVLDGDGDLQDGWLVSHQLAMCSTLTRSTRQYPTGITALKRRDHETKHEYSGLVPALVDHSVNKATRNHC